MRQKFSNKGSNYVVILAGGLSSRFQDKNPKQFFKINNHPIFYYSLKLFSDLNIFQNIILVVPNQFIKRTNSILKRYPFQNVILTTGGETRHLSTLEGLKKIENIKDEDTILFHDAARPCITQSDVLNLMQSLTVEKICTLASTITETIFLTEKQFTKKLLPREKIYSIKTPQGIKGSLLKTFLKSKIKIEPTDLCSWAKNFQKDTKIVNSEIQNIKITTKSDLKFADFFLQNL